MEADDLLCSGNARPGKALVGRAQWKINQPPSLEEMSELGRGGVDRTTYGEVECPRFRVHDSKLLRVEMRRSPGVCKGSNVETLLDTIESVSNAYAMSTV